MDAGAGNIVLWRLESKRPPVNLPEKCRKVYRSCKTPRQIGISLCYVSLALKSGKTEDMPELMAIWLEHLFEIRQIQESMRKAMASTSIILH